MNSLRAAVERHQDTGLFSTLHRGDVVRIETPRDADTAAAMCLILERGAGFIWMDPEWPEARAQYIRETVAATHALGGNPYRLQRERASDATSREGDATAYIIFTSGTTGNPKGVRVTHDNLAWIRAAWPEAIRLGMDERYLALTSFTFDPFIFDLWIPYVVGCEVFVADDLACRGRSGIAASIRAHRITALATTPTRLALYLAESDAGDATTLRKVIVGGEPLSADLVARANARGIRVFNAYGPTECTVACFVGEVSGSPIHIGKPMQGVEPDWEATESDPDVGTLIVRGPCVAAGYINSSSDAFFESGQGRGYRTGDLLRKDATGNYFFLGRADRQVKVRGFRVELGELEAIARKESHVVAAAAVMLNDEQELALMIVPSVAHGHSEIIATVENRLRRELPGYSLPAHIVVALELPLTAGGKTDIAAVERCVRAGRQVETHQDPLINAWCEVLGVSTGAVERSQSFRELGGHSLKMLQLMTKLRAHSFSFRAAEFMRADSLIEQRAILKMPETRREFTVATELPSLVPPCIPPIASFGILGLVGAVDFVVPRRVSHDELVNILNALADHNDALRLCVVVDSDHVVHGRWQTIKPVVAQVEISHSQAETALEMCASEVASQLDYELGPTFGVACAVSDKGVSLLRLLCCFHSLDQLGLQAARDSIRHTLQSDPLSRTATSQEAWLRCLLTEARHWPRVVAPMIPDARAERGTTREFVASVEDDACEQLFHNQGLHANCVALALSAILLHKQDVAVTNMLTASAGRALLQDADPFTLGRLAHYVPLDIAVCEDDVGSTYHRVFCAWSASRPEAASIQTILMGTSANAWYASRDLFCEYIELPGPRIFQGRRKQPGTHYPAKVAVLAGHATPRRMELRFYTAEVLDETRLTCDLQQALRDLVGV